MSQRFDYFVILAGMRTGSNFLESNLNAFEDITCYGEAFNPYFIGVPDQENVLGITVEQRDDDPFRLLNAMVAETKGMPGFRLFHNHDPRILEHVLKDHHCAKVVLTRNPVESFVSLRIAKETGQWKLTNVKHQKSADVRFDPEQFTHFLTEHQAYHGHIREVLQSGGQTAFHIDYADLQKIEVVNGLGQYLGASQPLDKLQNTLKRQNPGALRDKVRNPGEMDKALADVDLFEVDVVSVAEPARGASVPSYIAAPKTPLMFQPIPGGPTQVVKQWMADLDDVSPDALITGFTQKTLRKWMRENRGHRVFTVVRHPVERVYQTFCNKILSQNEQSYPEIRAKLTKAFNIPLPQDPFDPGYDLDAHREAFLGFLKFLKGNLSGQTALRVDSAWASQTHIIQGLSQVAPPDLVVRENNLTLALAYLAAEIGGQAPALTEPQNNTPYTLIETYSGDVEKQTKDVYSRDYLNFGFKPWGKSKSI
ncbi:MAG: sulfotransferase family 2 domain-containing protein [Pseudoruegeria sp.]